MEPELTPAASSPASELNTPAVAKPSLRDMTPDQRHSWRLTGEFPDAEPASSPAAAAEPAATAATSEPASEPAHDDPDYKPKTAKRIKELLDRAERAEKALAASSSTTRREPAAPPAATTAPVEPDPEAFTYGTADPAYVRAVTKYELALDKHERAEADRKTHTETSAKQLRESWKERTDKAREKHKDFDAVALQAPTEIPEGSLVDHWILESEYGAEVLYHLQKNPGELRRILSIGNGLHQTRELVKIEDSFAEPELKTLSTAPEPGPTLSARAGEPVNAVRAALKKRDVGSYIRERNREEIASRRGH